MPVTWVRKKSNGVYFPPDTQLGRQSFHLPLTRLSTSVQMKEGDASSSHKLHGPEGGARVAGVLPTAPASLAASLAEDQTAQTWPGKQSGGQAPPRRARPPKPESELREYQKLTTDEHFSVTSGLVPGR